MTQEKMQDCVALIGKKILELTAEKNRLTSAVSEKQKQLQELSAQSALGDNHKHETESLRNEIENLERTIKGIESTLLGLEKAKLASEKELTKFLIGNLTAELRQVDVEILEKVKEKFNLFKEIVNIENEVMELTEKKNSISSELSGTFGQTIPLKSDNILRPMMDELSVVLPNIFVGGSDLSGEIASLEKLLKEARNG